jgi:hypothetical protein
VEYKIKENNIKYEAGKYFVNIWGELYQIIYDEDQGYALLNVKQGLVDSEFHESIESLLKYTTITDMKPVKQTVAAVFEVVAE